MKNRRRTRPRARGRAENGGQTDERTTGKNFLGWGRKFLPFRPQKVFVIFWLL
jgi:hypothetical protein